MHNGHSAVIDIALKLMTSLSTDIVTNSSQKSIQTRVYQPTGGTTVVNKYMRVPADRRHHYSQYKHAHTNRQREHRETEVEENQQFANRN